MISISSVDKAFDAINEIDEAIEKCDVKRVMKKIKQAAIYGDQAFYEAGEEVWKREAILEKISEQIDRFNKECTCHKV